MKLITLELIEVQRHGQKHAHNLIPYLAIPQNLVLKVLQLIVSLAKELRDLIVGPGVYEYQILVVHVQVADGTRLVGLEHFQRPLHERVHQRLVRSNRADHVLLVLGKREQLDLDARQILGRLNYVAEAVHDHALDLLESGQELYFRVLGL